MTLCTVSKIGEVSSPLSLPALISAPQQTLSCTPDIVTHEQQLSGTSACWYAIKNSKNRAIHHDKIT